MTANTVVVNQSIFHFFKNSVLVLTYQCLKVVLHLEGPKVAFSKYSEKIAKFRKQLY